MSEDFERFLKKVILFFVFLILFSLFSPFIFLVFRMFFDVIIMVKDLILVIF